MPSRSHRCRGRTARSGRLQRAAQLRHEEVSWEGKRAEPVGWSGTRWRKCRSSARGAEERKPSKEVAGDPDRLWEDHDRTAEARRRKLPSWLVPALRAGGVGIAPVPPRRVPPQVSVRTWASKRRAKLPQIGGLAHSRSGSANRRACIPPPCQAMCSRPQPQDRREETRLKERSRPARRKSNRQRPERSSTRSILPLSCGRAELAARGWTD